MSFSMIPVFLAFILNRCSIRFFTTCRCILGFTPFSASVLFGLSLVAILVKHPELYPCWLRRANNKILFLYELFASIIFIEIGYCLWNSMEQLIFYKIPAFLEDNCSQLGDYYIAVVESPIGVSIISNFLALFLLLTTLHITRVCNFDLLLREDGVSQFFADAGLAPKDPCRHGRGSKNSRYMSVGPDIIQVSSSLPPSRPESPKCNQMQTIFKPKNLQNPKMLRSGKKIYTDLPKSPF